MAGVMPLPSETPTRHDDPFPRQQARTRRFALGAPRSFTVSPDGARVVFLRSSSARTRSTRCTCSTRPRRQGSSPTPSHELVGDDDLPAAERARRELMRETTSGITGYSSDTAATTAAFALSGRLHVVDLVGDDGARELDVPGPVVDPRLSPDGRHVAYVASGTVHVVAVDGSGHRVLLAPESATVTYGLADFIAAEELDRSRGLWWSPSSDALVVERSDEADVPLWYIADPASPQTAGRAPLPRGRAHQPGGVAAPGADRRRPEHPIEWDHDGSSTSSRSRGSVGTTRSSPCSAATSARCSPCGSTPRR
jgi:dipeptidyl-peptidase-4